MPKKDDLYVMTVVKDLTKYIITVTEKSPKKFRFTLVTRLQNKALDAVDRHRHRKFVLPHSSAHPAKTER